MRTLGQRLAALLWEQRAQLGYVLLLAGAGSGLALLAAGLARLVLARALPERAENLLETLVWASVANAIFRAWSAWLRTQARLYMETTLVRTLGHEGLQRTLRIPFAEHERLGFRFLLQALGSSENVTRAAIGHGTSVTLDLVTCAIYVCVLLAAAPALALAVLSAGLVLLSVAVVVALRASTHAERELQEGEQSRARLHEMLDGILTIKAQRAEHEARERWRLPMLRERRAALTRDLEATWVQSSLLASERAAQLLVLVLVAHEVLAQRATIADLVYRSALVSGALVSLTGLGRSVLTTSALLPHLQRARQLYQLELLPDPPRSMQALVREPAIRLSDVWFRHAPDQPWIVQGETLSVPLSSLHTLRGPSGSGKTTQLRLMAGLYRPERGAVSVLGADPYLDHGMITYLPQHTQLLAGSILENLERISGAARTRVLAACRLTGLDRWLASLPMGLETVLSTRGSNVSGGQRQWIMLTAAAAAERPIVLLDEALSQIDRHTRSTLDLGHIFAGKTIVHVAHDP
jgi:ABC-type bacteriocin/lantibiotic exporter with double-glycine peptidase domain